MRKISDTIARLASLQAQYSAHEATADAPDHLSALTWFGSNLGALQAKCYVPKNLKKGAPLVVVLHGCTQNAASYDRHSGWSQLADEEGFALLLPEQQRANNPNLCFNWFQPPDVGRDLGEALSIRQMIEAIVVAHHLDRKRIFITGLSAGGAMAAAMLASYPEVFAGGAIIAGLAFGTAATIPQAFDRMRGHGSPSEGDLQQALLNASDHRGPWPRISIWHGTADQTVAPSNAGVIATQWRGVHGLEKAPTHLEEAGPHARQVWRDGTGQAVIEVNLIAGMGHGTPIGNDGLGRQGPYMLDIGISSTREIARFWSITGSASKNLSPHSGQVGRPSEVAPPGLRATDVQHATASSAMRSGVRDKVSDAPGVKKIIEDALRAAGLMR